MNSARDKWKGERGKSACEGVFVLPSCKQEFYMTPTQRHVSEVSSSSKQRGKVGVHSVLGNMTRRLSFFVVHAKSLSATTTLLTDVLTVHRQTIMRVFFH